jgi:hypothetical protein
MESSLAEEEKAGLSAKRCQYPTLKKDMRQFRFSN